MCVIESVGVRAMGECGGCVCVHGVVSVLLLCCTFFFFFFCICFD